ncbi:TonB family C-terminal domain-containing protein [Tenacibaculum sp. MAR_2009_124]|uniref:energy transducer TonB n=1 Tax=Tenacibaculum sp. MAR_2009_124 TaxID=1250059 RepID=UPI00089B20FF|nr:energy transducer TonB [Tenacibaculum sp. MAR_2009_124]SEB41255.1 TonB family C-terminal domain-containing protein [Tenacibaculum sp. MAR_2009_124]
MKKLTILIALFVAQQIIAQEHCTSPKEEINNPNSISLNKCEVENEGNDAIETSKELPLRTRYLKRRKRSRKVDFVASIIEIEKPVKNLELANIKKNINNVVSNKANEKVEVSFSEVDTLPAFSSCNEGNMDEELCFNFGIQQHISSNFNYPKEALENKIEGIVLVSFVINSEGNVTELETIAPQNTEILKKEAIRIVSLLPKFVPGKHNGKEVNVSYSFPMEFKIN